MSGLLLHSITPFTLQRWRRKKDYSRGINFLMDNQGSFSWPQTKDKANENPDFIYNRNFEVTRRYGKRHNQKQVVMKEVKTEV